MCSVLIVGVGGAWGGRVEFLEAFFRFEHFHNQMLGEEKKKQCKPQSYITSLQSVFQQRAGIQRIFLNTSKISKKKTTASERTRRWLANTLREGLPLANKDPQRP